MIVEHARLKIERGMVLDVNNVFDMEHDNVTGTGPFLIGHGLICANGYCNGVVSNETFLSK